MSRQSRARKVSAREVLDLHLQEIARRNPELNAIVTFTPELRGHRRSRRTGRRLTENSWDYCMSCQWRI